LTPCLTPATPGKPLEADHHNCGGKMKTFTISFTSPVRWGVYLGNTLVKGYFPSLKDAQNYLDGIRNKVKKYR
jgi:hypothetical protein